MSPDPNWRVCVGEECGKEYMLKWSKTPDDLAFEGRSDAMALPGIQAKALAIVQRRWPQEPHGSLSEIVAAVRSTLTTDPFGTNSTVPYIELAPGGRSKTVALTGEQVAFLISNVLMGNTVPMGTRLSALLSSCTNSEAVASLALALLKAFTRLKKEAGGGSSETYIIASTPKQPSAGWAEGIFSESQKLLEPAVLGVGASPKKSFGLVGEVIPILPGFSYCPTNGDPSSPEISELSKFLEFPEILAFQFFLPMASSSSSSGPGLGYPMAYLGIRRAPSRPSPANALRSGLEATTETRTVYAFGRYLPVYEGSALFVPLSDRFDLCSRSEAHCDKAQQTASQWDQLTQLYSTLDVALYPLELLESFAGLVESIKLTLPTSIKTAAAAQRYALLTWLAASLTNKPLVVQAGDTLTSCYLLRKEGCSSCLSSLGAAFDAGCGRNSLEDVFAAFQHRHANDLLTALLALPFDQAPSGSGGEGSLFDQLLAYERDAAERPSSSSSSKLRASGSSSSSASSPSTSSSSSAWLLPWTDPSSSSSSSSSSSQDQGQDQDPAWPLDQLHFPGLPGLPGLPKLDFSGFPSPPGLPQLDFSGFPSFPDPSNMFNSVQNSLFGNWTEDPTISMNSTAALEWVEEAPSEAKGAVLITTGLLLIYLGLRRRLFPGTNKRRGYTQFPTSASSLAAVHQQSKSQRSLPSTSTSAPSRLSKSLLRR